MQLDAMIKNCKWIKKVKKKINMINDTDKCISQL